MYNFKFSIIIAVYNSEKYIKETVESVISQDIGFEDNVQLILVNDGSTDDSLVVLEEYQEKFPNNIVVLTKENGGQSSARNLGLTRAEGEFFNFLDSDDKLTLNTLSHVYNFSKKHNVNILAIPMRFFGDIEDEHILNSKFDHDKVINVFEDFEYPQLSISSCFIKSHCLKGHTFDIRFNIGEDATLINKILLDERSIAFLSSPTYLYRKRLDNSSTMDNLKYTDALYFDKTEYFHKELINYSIEKIGYVPKFIQNVIAYDLQWYFMHCKYDEDDEKYKLFMKSLGEILSFIDSDIIINHKFIPRNKKSFLMYLKNDEFHVETGNGNRFILKTNDYVISRSHKHKVYLDIVDLKEDCLNISGYFKSNCDSDSLSIKAVVENNGKQYTYPVNVVEYPTSGRITKYKLNIPWIFYYNFDLKVNLKNEDNYKIYFKLTFKEDDENIVTTSLDVGFRIHCNLSNVSNYYVSGSKIVLFKGKSIHVVKYSYKFMCKLELFVLMNLIKLSYPYKFQSILLRLIYILLFQLMRKKNIWLFMDRLDYADDNGEHFFRYANDQSDGVKKYYVLNNDSPDFRRLSDEYDNILSTSSFKYKCLYLFSKKIITSHPDLRIVNPFYNMKNIKLLSGISTKPIYFLQHGVTKDNVSSWLKKYSKNIRLLVTLSDFEAKSFLDPGYNYEKDIIQTLGFPRYDNLDNTNTRNQISIMPSWRHYFNVSSDEEIVNSEYAKHWIGLINNSKLIDYLKNHDYEIIFKPHPNFSRYLDLFEINGYVKIDKDNNIRYQKVFNESSILITDYSSVSFDFAYLKKPLFYYQYGNDYHFDVENGYFNYENMGFGDVVKYEDALIEKIIKTIENDCVMEDKYKKRVDRFFKFKDKQNCKRVYDWILRN